ncbi:glycosyltransferase [Mesorhizobium sp.]|uniref:glycosyltransferase n=1 Tax=Mesorhizobium sp. TaxID=1871066 RepID=UPI00261B36BA|nr:glycosyltransferase [Mesorhizobium sp.]
MTPAGSVSVSVIVNTYNWPGALKLSLQSLASQTDRCFEVIIADDGSRQDTADVIKLFTDSASIPVRHVWHEDIGFRRSAILNKAIGEACGPYLIFVDGDCILQPDFVAQHRALAKPNYVITGSRILLSQEFSKQLLAAGTWNYPSIPPEYPAAPVERRHFQDRRVFRAAALADDVGLSFLRLPAH